jgi:hypothetical protein
MKGNLKLDGQCTYKVMLRLVRAAIVAVEKQ